MTKLTKEEALEQLAAGKRTCGHLEHAYLKVPCAVCELEAKLEESEKLVKQLQRSGQIGSWVILHLADRLREYDDKWTPALISEAFESAEEAVNILNQKAGQK